jgi:hypothetical protein
MDGAVEELIRELRERIGALEAENRQLRDQLDEANRKAARQAAPFRRRDSRMVPVGQKKRPGRPKGHEGARRVVPERVDVSVDVPLSGCPGCGGPVSDVTPVEQFIEDLPVIRPWVTRLVTYQGTCLCCGDVCSKHPLQTSTATGAAKVQLGPRALAIAIRLKEQYGISFRNACKLLESHLGLKFSAGGLAQAAQRAAERVKPCFDQLVNEVRDAAAVFADETSWYVGAAGYWLWTFTTADAPSSMSTTAAVVRSFSTSSGQPSTASSSATASRVTRTSPTRPTNASPIIKGRSPRPWPDPIRPTRATSPIGSISS